MTAADLKAKCEALAAAGDAQSMATLLLFARVKELEDALQPFAEYRYADEELTHLPLGERDKEAVGWGWNSPTYGDCRRAAELLKGDA